MCVELEAMQDIGDNDIYSPLNPIDRSKQPLQDCVISIRCDHCCAYKHECSFIFAHVVVFTVVTQEWSVTC